MEIYESAIRRVVIDGAKEKLMTKGKEKRKEDNKENTRIKR